jgi:hypothetical protein
MNKNDVSAAEDALIQSAKTLLDAGWTRGQINNALREKLPPYATEADRKAIAVRHIRVMRDVAAGMPIKQVKAKHGLKAMYAQKALLTGREKVIKVLALSPEQYRPFTPVSDHPHWWINKAIEALQALGERDQ